MVMRSFPRWLLPVPSIPLPQKKSWGDDSTRAACGVFNVPKSVSRGPLWHENFRSKAACMTASLRASQSGCSSSGVLASAVRPILAASSGLGALMMSSIMSLDAL